MSTLFKQNPKEDHKYKPKSETRKIASLKITRKKDLEKFRDWMVGVSKEKSDLPKQKELDELNKEATKGKGIGLGLLGVLAAIPLAALALGGGFKGLKDMASNAVSFITGGGNKSAGSGDDLLGLKGQQQESKGWLENLFGGPNTSTQSSTPLMPEMPTLQAPSAPVSAPLSSQSRPTAVVTGGADSGGDPNQAADNMADVIKDLQKKGYRVVIVPPGTDNPDMHNAVVGAAQAHGAIIEIGEYGTSTGNAPPQITPESHTAIRNKYPNSVAFGGNANEILNQAQSLPSAKSTNAPSAPSPLQEVPAINQLSLPPLPPTGTLGTGAQMYGASRDGGSRKHAGQDFDAGPNGTFYSRIGGEVIYSANAGGGYGNVVDVYNEQLGVTERIAEGDRNLVNAGDMIRAGTPVQQGTAQTGVFHYEIRDGRATNSGSFAGTRDPIQFLNNLSQGVIQQAQPQQTTQPGQSRQQNAQPQQKFDLKQSFQGLMQSLSGPYKQMLSMIEMFNNPDDIVLWRDRDKVKKSESVYGFDANFSGISPVSNGMNVEELDPLAKAALGDVLIIDGSGNPTIVNGADAATGEMPVAMGGGGNRTAVAYILGESSAKLYQNAFATKIG